MRGACDLYVLKKISGVALSLAAALYGRGAAILNAYPVTVTLRDKIVMSHILQAAGVPTPATTVKLTWGLLALTVGLAIVGLLVSESRISTGALAIETFRAQPLSFEANHGQTDPRVDFLTRGIGHAVFVTASEAVLVLTAPDSTGVILRMRFVGANPRPRVAGLEELPGKANYFVGNDRTKWRTNVPRHASVQYTGLYPGIDLRYSGDQRHLAYDFVVHPGADAKRIVLAWQGVDSLAWDGQGDLVLHTAAGMVRQGKPVISQELNGARLKIAGRYVRTAADEVGVEVAAYDLSRPLVISGIAPFSFHTPHVATTAYRARSIPHRSLITPIIPMK